MRCAARLALFAMMLIVVAPQVSMALRHHTAAGMHHDMMMPDAPGQHVDHAQACGYCVLLGHVPGILWPLLTLLISLGGRWRAVACPAPRRELLRCFWSRPPCRAPPALSSLH